MSSLMATAVPLNDEALDQACQNCAVLASVTDGDKLRVGAVEWSIDGHSMFQGLWRLRAPDKQEMLKTVRDTVQSLLVTSVPCVRQMMSFARDTEHNAYRWLEKSDADWAPIRAASTTTKRVQSAMQNMLKGLRVLRGSTYAHDAAFVGELTKLLSFLEAKLDELAKGMSRYTRACQQVGQLRAGTGRGPSPASCE